MILYKKSNTEVLRPIQNDARRAETSSLVMATARTSSTTISRRLSHECRHNKGNSRVFEQIGFCRPVCAFSSLCSSVIESEHVQVAAAGPLVAGDVADARVVSIRVAALLN